MLLGESPLSLAQLVFINLPKSVSKLPPVFKIFVLSIFEWPL